MALNFPANPAGQTPINTFSPSSTPDATTNGATYVWNGTAWTGSVDGVGVSIVSSASFPATATPNDLLFNTENGKLYIYYQDVDSNQWVDTSADSTSSLVIMSENPPPNPVQGELWWDTSTDGGVLYIYYSDVDSNQWVEVGGSSGGGGGDATVESGSIPPENPKVNTLWFNDVTGRLYIYYQDADGSQWVDTDVGGTTEQMPTGGGQNRIFYENQQSVTDNYTLDAGTNAMSAGPVTVDNGVSVTVPAGQTWTVVGGASGGGGGGDSGFWQRSGTTLSPATGGDNVSTTGNISGAGGAFSATGTFGSFDSAQTTANGARIGSEGQITAQRSSATATSAAIDILSGNTPTFAVLGTGETRIGGNVAGADPNITLNANGSAQFSNTVQSVSFYGNGSTGTAQIWSGAQSGGSSTSIIRADGSAQFSNTVQSVSFFGNDTTATSQVFTGGLSGTVTSNIRANGQAYFSGNTGVGGTSSSAPNISLNADGTVVTTADATINGLTVGRGAGDVLTNVALGSGTFASNSAGAFNVAVGAGAAALTASNSNVAVGSSALSNLMSGQCNTAVGANAGATFTTGGGNIAIGVMNSLGQTAPVFAGSIQNNIIGMGHTSIANAYVQVTWTVTSDARDKMNFGSVPHGLDFVKQLQPVQYQFKFDRQSDEANGPVRYGFKAQDILALEGADPVIIDADDADKLKYRGESLVPVLVNAIQELSAKIETLEAKVAALES